MHMIMICNYFSSPKIKKSKLELMQTLLPKDSLQIDEWQDIRHRSATELLPAAPFRISLVGFDHARVNVQRDLFRYSPSTAQVG